MLLRIALFNVTFYFVPPPSHQVVDLINQAQLYTKDNLKIENLKKVQELVIHKEPALLDNFLDVSYKDESYYMYVKSMERNI